MQWPLDHCLAPLLLVLVPQTLLTLLTLVALAINFPEVWRYCGWLRHPAPPWMVDTLIGPIAYGDSGMFTTCQLIQDIFHPHVPLRGDRRSAEGSARHCGGRPGASAEESVLLGGFLAMWIGDDWFNGLV